MKRFRNTLLTALVLGIAPALAAQFTVSSPDVRPGAGLQAAQVLNGFGCSGGNRSPALSWSGAPAGTKGFAVTLYDPDAPTGSGWWHWLVYNLPAKTLGLADGAGDGAGLHLPAGAVQGVTDFGSMGYGGPCPPQGDAPHRYVFMVYALDVTALDLPRGASNALVRFTLHAHTLATATLTAKYGR